MRLPSPNNPNFVVVQVFALVALMGALFFGAGCAIGPANQPKAPATYLENIEAMKVSNDVAHKKIADVTCQHYKAGTCTDPGFTIDADRAAQLLKDSDRLNATLKAAANIPAGAMGDCGGTLQTQASCTATLQDLLNTLQAALVPPPK